LFATIPNDHQRGSEPSWAISHDANIWLGSTQSCAAIVVACDAHIEQERTDIDGYHHEAVNRHGVRIIQRIGNGAYRDTRNWRRTMRLTQFAVDDGPHNSDGLVLHGLDGDQQVTGFISRRVMDDWVDPRQPYRGRKSLYREQYNALGKRNLAAIERMVTSKYERGPAFNRQYPFVDILLSDIIESEETLDTSELVSNRRLPLSN
jgi:hypothetical protein